MIIPDLIKSDFASAMGVREMQEVGDSVRADDGFLEGYQKALETMLEEVAGIGICFDCLVRIPSGFMTAEDESD
jgi:hypothetical protein